VQIWLLSGSGRVPRGGRREAKGSLGRVIMARIRRVFHVERLGRSALDLWGGVWRVGGLLHGWFDADGWVGVG